ncbi:unnamed protein product [Acidithrix sp. C25]|nr:unnamed protein product [Acidithrix sp. C25]
MALAKNRRYHAANGDMHAKESRHAKIADRTLKVSTHLIGVLAF